MSLTFLIPSDDVDANQALLEDPVVQGLTGRGVEVHSSDRGLEVRILAGSNRADHQLALTLVRRFAVARHASILPDGGDEIAIEAFDVQYGADWVDIQLSSTPPTIANPVAPANVEATPDEQKVYTTLAEFWPYYLSDHRDPLNRALHVAGSLGALCWLAAAVVLGNPWLVLAGLVNGYAFAWVGHFIVEKNRPATFTYPVMSFVSDWKMLFYILTFQIEGKLAELDD
ncbi:MAG: DUF962 domain-containing protein [Rhodobacterales bacterium]|nr:DUF962 domain-containing protein [Rhodobacterales bacterium]